MTCAKETAQTWIIGLLLGLAVMALFWPALDCDFVNYDDPAYITSNQDVQHGLNKESIIWAFTTGAASNWHPLTWLSHILDVQLYGLNPKWHHLTSLLLHMANSILLFLILKRMTGGLWRSAMVAALFALHPMRVESVVWISERKDVLSTFFWMLTVGAYARYAEEFKVLSSKFKIYYGFAILFFAFGLMAKPMLVTLPFVLLLLDYWPLQRFQFPEWQGFSRLLLEKIPFFAMAVASSVVTFIVQKHGGAVSALTGLPFPARVGNAFIAYTRYLGKTIWPVDLSVLYPHPGHWPIIQIIAAVVFLTLVTGAVIWRWRAQPYLIVGWFWFVGMLVPAIGLVQVGIQSMADRYSYVPIIGIFIMAVWGTAELTARLSFGKWVAGIFGGLVLVICAVMTPLQVKFWQNSETLFLHAVDATENNYLAYNNLGFFYSNMGQTERAMKFYQSSLKINPNYEEAHNNLGYALAELGRYQEAIPEYIAALSIKPTLTEAHNNLGNALSNVGRVGEAMHEYQVAIEEDPRHADSHNNYGIALAMHGMLDEAIQQFQMAVRYKENYASAHSNLGNAYAAQHKLEEASREYLISLRINPNDPQAHNNLANVFTEQGKLDDAIVQYHAALKLKPENPEAHFNLGICLSRRGDRAGAIEQYTIALQQRPDYPDAQRQLESIKNGQ